MKIAVIGVNLGHQRWSTVFEILDSAADAGITYQKFSPKDVDGARGAHAVVWLATPDLKWSCPSVHFTLTTTEDEIIKGMQDLASKLMGEEDDTIPEVDDRPVQDEPVDAVADVEANSGNNTASALAGLVVEIAGKEVVLNKEDAIQLKDMLVVMKEYGYKVKDVIITG